MQLSKLRSHSFQHLTNFLSSEGRVLQRTQLRRLSAKPSILTNDTTKAGESSSVTSEESNCLLLYRRAPNRVWFPRSLLAFTTVHTGYWAWYVFDFVPAMNAAAPSEITVDSTVGYVGWAMSAFMWGFSCMYPKFLINEVLLNKTTKELLVKTYKLPFVTVPTNSGTAYSSLSIDPKIIDMNKLLTTYTGDMSNLRGHIGIQITDERYTSPNLLLHLTENADKEIHRNHLFLQSLVSPSTTSSKSKYKNDQSSKTVAPYPNQTTLVNNNSNEKDQTLNSVDNMETTLHSTSDGISNQKKKNKARQQHQQKIKRMRRRQMLSKRN